MEFQWDREHNKGLRVQFNNLMAIFVNCGHTVLGIANANANQ
jgi:hypothetical protein